MASGHGCYDEETDVLTKEGWKNWADVDGSEELATRYIDGTLAYERPCRIVHTPYSGKMYRVESQGVDLLVTPNHKMFVCLTTTKRGRKRKEIDYKLIKADELDRLPCVYIKIAKRNCEFYNNYSKTQCEFLGFCIGDGNWQSGKTIKFRLRRHRKVSWLKIKCKQLGYDLKIRNDHYTVSVTDELANEFPNIYNKNKEKQIPPLLLKEGSQQQLHGILLGMIESDGSKNTGTSFDTTSSVLVEQFQQLCLHAGLSANHSYTYTRDQRLTSFGSKPLTRFYIISRSNKPEINKYANAVGKSFWIDNFEGVVHCAELPHHDKSTHTLYVRRNGKPVWCGNSVLEHSVYNFGIEGLSRVATAELNRHRAGWAISEQSLRYVRYTDIPYWLPESIQSNPEDNEEIANIKDETRNLFREAFEHQEMIYGKLCALWDIDDSSHAFKYKKKATSLFRRIIGMGVATAGIWSGNIRAIRHVLGMRCTPEAEEEICYIFSKICKMMVEREPALFGDFAKDEAGYWKPKYFKI